VDNTHVWCFCKVNVLSLKKDESKNEKEKDVIKRLKDGKEQATQTTKQEANYTKVESMNFFRTTHEGCPGYTNDASAKKKGFYGCQSTPIPSPNNPEIPMEARYPDNFYVSSERSDNFNLGAMIAKKTVEIVLKIGLTAAIAPILVPALGTLYTMGAEDLGDNIVGAIWGGKKEED